MKRKNLFAVGIGSGVLSLCCGGVFLTSVANSFDSDPVEDVRPVVEAVPTTTPTRSPAEIAASSVAASRSAAAQRNIEEFDRRYEEERQRVYEEEAREQAEHERQQAEDEAQQEEEVSGSNDVYYASCAEARADGAAPVHAGEPGYRLGLDRDKDGTACDT